MMLDVSDEAQVGSRRDRRRVRQARDRELPRHRVRGPHDPDVAVRRVPSNAVCGGGGELRKVATADAHRQACQRPLAAPGAEAAALAARSRGRQQRGERDRRAAGVENLSEGVERSRVVRVEVRAAQELKGRVCESDRRDGGRSLQRPRHHLDGGRLVRKVRWGKGDLEGLEEGRVGREHAFSVPIEAVHAAEVQGDCGEEDEDERDGAERVVIPGRVLALNLFEPVQERDEAVQHNHKRAADDGHAAELVGVE
mmetsp:Transcript_38695/g.115047  ORF Transcript_38695/g.115047 Transcript_38695/m.115047 type:complete len:254 (+) Transcript_38695:649-1410(+)